MAHSRKSEVRSVSVPEEKSIEMILLRIKKRLASKGSKGFLLFEKGLKHADSDEDGLVSLEQFKTVIRDQKIDITNTESQTVFNIFNQEDLGSINYQEVLHTLRGVIPE